MKLLERLKRATLRLAKLWQAERSVAVLFARLHPKERGTLLLKANEPDRFVFMVLLHGRTKPPKYEFFYVNKTDLTTWVMEDDSHYRPRIWR